jgi:hypothetical protein
MKLNKYEKWQVYFTHNKIQQSTFAHAQITNTRMTNQCMKWLNIKSSFGLVLICEHIGLVLVFGTFKTFHTSLVFLLGT